MSIRISDGYLASILVGDLNRSLGAMLKQQQMAGSMRRVNSFADDPRAVGAIQRYNSLIANNEEYGKNVNRSRIIVDSTDVALQDMSSILTDVRVISLRESSALGTPGSMGTSVVEVQALVSRMMDVLNTTVEGNYIFSGRATSTPPFKLSGNTVLYQGDTGEIRSRTGPNSTMVVNIPGDVFMGSQTSTLGGTADMAPKLAPTTVLADLNLGQGWTPGSISLADGAGNVWQVDLSSALTVADVTAAVNTATGGAITANINATGNALGFVGTGPLTIGEVDGGGTAVSLGINADAAGSILTGRDVRASAEITTPLDSVASLAGKLPLGMVNVSWQGSQYSVDLSTATSLGDVAALFNAAVPSMELQVKNSALTVVGGRPETFSISNGDVSNSATALGIAGDGTPVRLFGMMEDLQAALIAGDKDLIRGIVNELAGLQDKNHELLMRNGARQSDLDWAENILNQRNERLRGNLSLERDVDIAQVASDLSRAEKSYQASLLVTSKLFQTNLMQYLR